MWQRVGEGGSFPRKVHRLLSEGGVWPLMWQMPRASRGKPQGARVRERSGHGGVQCKDPEAIQGLPWGSEAFRRCRSSCQKSAESPFLCVEEILLTFSQQIASFPEPGYDLWLALSSIVPSKTKRKKTSPLPERSRKMLFWLLSGQSSGPRPGELGSVPAPHPFLCSLVLFLCLSPHL